MKGMRQGTPVEKATRRGLRNGKVQWSQIEDVDNFVLRAAVVGCSTKVMIMEAVAKRVNQQGQSSLYSESRVERMVNNSLARLKVANRLHFVKRSWIPKRGTRKEPARIPPSKESVLAQVQNALPIAQAGAAYREEQGLRPSPVQLALEAALAYLEAV